LKCRERLLARPLSPAFQDSARRRQPDRKGQWCGRSEERAAWKHKSAW